MREMTDDRGERCTLTPSVPVLGFWNVEHVNNPLGLFYTHRYDSGYMRSLIVPVYKLGMEVVRLIAEETDGS